MSLRRLLARSLTFSAAVLCLSSCRDGNDAAPRDQERAGRLVRGGGEWAAYRHDIHSTWYNPALFTAADALALTPSWTFSANSSTFAEPIIANGVVYLTTAGSKGGKIYALDAETGAQRWVRSFPNTGIDPCTGAAAPAGIQAAASVVNGVVYIDAADGVLYALDAATGATRWQARITDPTKGETMVDSPVVSTALGKVFIATSATAEDCLISPHVAAIDLATGTAKIRIFLAPGNRGGSIWSSLTVDEGMRRVFATTGNSPQESPTPPVDPLTQSFVAFDADTLDVVDHWKIPTRASIDADFGASPTLFTAADGTPLLGTTNKDGFLYVLRRDNLAAGAIWKYPIAVYGDPVAGTSAIVAPSFADGVLYAAGEQTPAGEPGQVIAFEPGTGAIRWKHITKGYVLPGMPILGDVLIVAETTVGNASATIELLDRSNGTVIRSYAVNAAVWGAPSAGEGKLLFTDIQGHLQVHALPSAGGAPDGGTIDAGTPDAGTPDAGTPDAGTPDAGTADAGTADAGTLDGGSGGGTDGGMPPPGAVLFADDFNRSDSSSLGPRWTVRAGAWITDSRANADRSTVDRAVPAGVSCADCRIDAKMVGFGTECGFTLREATGGNRYDLILTTGGRLRIRRWRGGAVTVLGDVASGIPDRGNWATFAFAASGAGPVMLTATVDGRQALAVTDSSAEAITTAGAAGLYATAAGTWFDDFTLTALGQGGGGSTGPDGGTTGDGGTAQDGGTDAGVDGGLGDDGGTSVDGGTGDGGSPSGTVLFADDFNRNDSSSLGPSWTITSGAWITDSRANADRRMVDRASPSNVTCLDCRIDARMVGFGTECGFTLREGRGGDRYDLIVTTGARLRIRRWRSGVATVLGDVPSGFDVKNWATLAFAVSSENPVSLTATVNGRQVLAVADSSAGAITTAGGAGLYATAAGTWFDDFKLTSLQDGGGGSDGGTPSDGGIATDGGSGTDGGMDGGTPQPGTVLFSDAFNRNDPSSLGPNWTVAAGAFITDSRANADRNALDRAFVRGIVCADCQINTRLVGFGTELAVTLREASGSTIGDRYDAAITSSGRLRIRRWRGGSATVLGDVASGIPDLTDWATISFTVSGTAPVMLTVAVNGTPKLTVADGSAQALTTAGSAGLSATAAGVWFDDFTLRAVAASGP